jgi:hypothetical protein
MYKDLVKGGVSGTAAAQHAEMAALTGGAVLTDSELQGQVLELTKVAEVHETALADAATHIAELQAQLEAEQAAHAATKAALDAATATGGV